MRCFTYIPEFLSYNMCHLTSIFKMEHNMYLSMGGKSCPHTCRNN